MAGATSSALLLPAVPATGYKEDALEWTSDQHSLLLTETEVCRGSGVSWRARGREADTSGCRCHPALGFLSS